MNSGGQMKSFGTGQLRKLKTNPVVGDGTNEVFDSSLQQVVQLLLAPPNRRTAEFRPRPFRVDVVEKTGDFKLVSQPDNVCHDQRVAACAPNHQFLFHKLLASPAAPAGPWRRRISCRLDYISARRAPYTVRLLS